MSEIISLIYENDKIRVEKISSYGSPSPEGFYYNQSEDEFVILNQGSAELIIDGVMTVLNQGDSIYIKAHSLHRVESVSNDAQWICIYIKNF